MPHQVLFLALNQKLYTGHPFLQQRAILLHSLDFLPFGRVQTPPGRYFLPRRNLGIILVIVVVFFGVFSDFVLGILLLSLGAQFSSFGSVASMLVRTFP